MREHSRALCLEFLTATKWDVGAAARAAGMSRSRMFKLIAIHGLKRPARKRKPVSCRFGIRR